MSFFKKNISSLIARYPRYESLCKGMSPPGKETIYSNKEQEKAWLDEVLPAHSKHVFLLGCYGAHTLALIRKHPHVHTLVIVERNVERLAAVLDQEVLEGCIQDENIFWLIRTSGAELEQHLRARWLRFAADGCTVIQSPLVGKQEREEFLAVRKSISQCLQKTSALIQAHLRLGNVVQRNVIQNLHVILESRSLDAVKDSFPGVPAIIVGAGPSLDKNVFHLQNVEDRAVILATDTAAKVLFQHEIIPHFILTSDPTPHNEKHFRGWELPEHTWLAYSISSYFENLKRYRSHARKVCVLTENNSFNLFLSDVLNIDRLAGSPHHVGELAIRLALYMRCDPLVLVGMDLALSRDGLTHAQDTARAAKVVAMEKNMAQLQDEEGNRRELRLIEVPGYDGKPVFTQPFFYEYLRQLETLIQSVPVTWIDATEGGALKQGCRKESLAHVVAHIPPKPMDIQHRLNRAITLDKEAATVLRQALQGGIVQLKEYDQRFSSLHVDESNVEKYTELWEGFLSEKTVEILLGHALFPLRLRPPVHYLPMQERKGYLQECFAEARKVMDVFLPMWDDVMGAFPS